MAIVVFVPVPHQKAFQKIKPRRLEAMSEALKDKKECEIYKVPEDNRDKRN